MYLSPEIHAQVVRDRQQALRRDAAAHRLVTRTRPCSTIAHVLRRAAVLIGVATVSAGGCGGRREPSVADAR
jgi:hypothetical protein